MVDADAAGTLLHLGNRLLSGSIAKARNLTVGVAENFANDLIIGPAEDIYDLATGHADRVEGRVLAKVVSDDAALHSTIASAEKLVQHPVDTTVAAVSSITPEDVGGWLTDGMFFYLGARSGSPLAQEDVFGAAGREMAESLATPTGAADAPAPPEAPKLLEGEPSDAPPTRECTGGKCLGNCFAAGTLVDTERGLRPIETIQPGDRVLTRDEASGAIAYKPVVRTIVTEHRAMTALSLVSPAGSETIFVTPNHPFFVHGRGWVQASDLSPTDDELSNACGVAVNVSAALSLRESATAYNLEVEDYHTYFVGRSEAWVHNQTAGACPSITQGLTPLPARDYFLRLNPDEATIADYEAFANKPVTYRNSFPQEFIPFEQFSSDTQAAMQQAWSRSWESVPHTAANVDQFSEVGFWEVTLKNGQHLLSDPITSGAQRAVSKEDVEKGLEELMSLHQLGYSELSSASFFHTHPPVTRNIPGGPFLSTGDFGAQQSTKAFLVEKGADVPLHIYSTTEVTGVLATFHSGIP